jgi:hypothetical protein
MKTAGAPEGDRIGGRSETLMNPSTTISDKLEALRKRESTLRAAIAVEKVRQQKRRARDDARVYAVVGEALALHAAKSADFRLMLTQVLQSSELSDSDRSFLAKKGWL